MKYAHLVTITYTNKNGDTENIMCTLETKKLIPTMSEWNDFIKSIKVLEEHKNAWTVLSIVTLQK